MVQFATLRTEFGNIGVLVSNSKLIKIILPNKLESISIELTNPQNHEPFMSKVLDQLNQYFIGRRKQFDLDLSLQVSPCLLYTSPSPRDGLLSRMPSSA